MDGQSSSAARRHRRVRSSRVVTREHLKSSSSVESSSMDSDTYPSSPDVSSASARPYQVRHPTIASPSTAMASAMATPSVSAQSKDKQRAVSHTNGSPPSTLSSAFHSSHSPLGPSMLSSSSYKSINLSSRMSHGDSDEPPRLITYTKHSQGFTWNDELFVPSYLVNRNRYGGGHRAGMRRNNLFSDDLLGDEDDGLGDFDEHGEQCPVTDIFVTDEEAAALMP